MFSEHTSKCMPSYPPEALDQPNPSITSPAEHKTSSRNYLKCWQCRRDRKSCSRDPTDPTQKCNRCKELGHHCGPSFKATRRRKLSAVSGNMNISSCDTSSMHDPKAGNPHPSYRTTPWSLSGGADFGRQSFGVAINVSVQRLFVRALFDLETSVAYERTPDAANVLWTHCQQLCQDLQSQISRQLAHLESNRLYPRPPRHATPFTLSTEIAQSVDATSGEFISLICTSNVLQPCQPIGSQHQGHARNSVNELPLGYYQSTEAALNELIISISRQNPGQWSIPHHQETNLTIGAQSHGLFPASHIAYMNLDRESAYQLWLLTASEGTVVDVLGRSFPHMVAEAGDSKLLDRMSTVDLKYVGLDARGLSLLDLGIIGDSALIVRTVIENGIVCAPYTRAMQRAIAGRRLDIAEYLLPHLTFMPWNDSFELNVLASLAGECGFLTLQDNLERVELSETSPQEVVDCLDTLGLHLGSDEPVIPESVSFDSSAGSDWMFQPAIPSIPDVLGDSETGVDDTYVLSFWQLNSQS